jgi:uncharacterized tellurite resistance protein B-like protein
MNDTKNYQLGLLYLTHLLISADGIINEKEYSSLNRIKREENIPDKVFKEFESEIKELKEKDIYQHGINYMSDCSDELKLRAFAHLYKMSDVDGSVHVKEVRLLLYSIRAAGIEFNDVIERAKTL